MRRYGILIVLAVLMMSFSAYSQFGTEYSSSRLSNLANRLKGYTVDLSERTYDSLRNGYNNSRSEIEAAFLAQQADASAGLFQQMVRDNRRASELRDAASILSDIARRSPSYGYNSNYWRDVQRTIEDINRELGGNGGGGWGNSDPGNDPANDRNVLGRARWRGTVDNEVHLAIRNNTLDTRIFAGQNYGPGNYTFTSPLPNRAVQVYVTKKKGRGGVKVIQQPDRFNDFTAVIKILDDDGGAKEYDVEIFWK